MYINLRDKTVIVFYSKAFCKYVTSSGYFTNFLFILYFFSDLYILNMENNSFTYTLTSPFHFGSQTSTYFMSMPFCIQYLFALDN